MRPPLIGLLVLLVTVGGVAIWQTAAPLFATDCGSADQRSADFAEAGRDCFWSAYSTGNSAKWTMTRSTLEGDPISYTVTLSRQSIELIQDTSADRFGGPNKGRTMWRCSELTKVARPAGSFQFAFGNCTGDGSPPSPL